MANSVDPDQTPHSAHLIWVYTVCKDLSVPKLRVNMSRLICRQIFSYFYKFLTEIRKKKSILFYDSSFCIVACQMSKIVGHVSPPRDK